MATSIALVTGAGSGIGRAVCRRFAQAGIQVMAIDRNGDEAKSTASALEGAGHQGMSCDVASQTQVNETVENIIKSMGKDIRTVSLINSAGITRDKGFLKMTEEEWDAVNDVNLKGTFLTTQAVCRAMVTKGLTGSIVNISSISGKGGNMGQANYAASKSGVVGFTKTVAKELGSKNIRCNAIMPGMIETPMIATIPDKVQAMVKQMIPMGEIGKPEDIANACFFLSSDQARYITGQTIEVTGGLGM
ncbi:estradiol 17-beta-dehydrogenase 8 [Sphaeroforma arctica JP610]|uniref:(3R)-3-hydroxyacyl-CoA dehydrogenase n=1 Tax=Sphaeroforma arctica JP610 TaxID=667725 RepID=A0A0L0FMK6_9EUKA|nr:estradiol 17-beta-dehydrogenase 8 [Sphaeroforma arctica JP610]KNC77263.1 estradiol 17-beta-dehydrogenase 8 [Sphaeroforma arctica JP610]|eukprot:XP_014151165.1 estradiol 17-beta-dehydrogenase 8 [Sphaeroforma arctica JP610]